MARGWRKLLNEQQVKRSYPCNGPWGSIGLRDVEDLILSRQWTLRAGFASHQRDILVFIPLKGSAHPKAMVRLEGLCKLKTISDLKGREPVRRLNFVRYGVSRCLMRGFAKHQMVTPRKRGT
jgi:hypothetical protein